LAPANGSEVLDGVAGAGKFADGHDDEDNAQSQAQAPNCNPPGFAWFVCGLVDFHSVGCSQSQGDSRQKANGELFAGALVDRDRPERRFGCGL
jgi:hypothetical protein